MEAVRPAAFATVADPTVAPSIPAISPARLAAFGASLKGTLIVPGDAAFEMSRQVHNSRFDSRPHDRRPGGGRRRRLANRHPKVEDDPALGGPMAREAVAAAPDGELEAGLGRHGWTDVDGGADGTPRRRRGPSRGRTDQLRREPIRRASGR